MAITRGTPQRCQEKYQATQFTKFATRFTLAAEIFGFLPMINELRQMLLCGPRRFRQLLLVGLMAFTLVGVQAVQASPLHDHTHHSVDCALCHLQLSSDGVSEPLFTFDYVAPAVCYAQLLREFYSFSNPSPYQGRAPPYLSR